MEYGVKDEYGSFNARLFNGKPVTNVDYPRYFSTIRSIQSRYGHQLQIKAGLEFGVQMHTQEAFVKLVSKYPLDFIILSIHQVDDQEFWTQEFQKGRTQAEYNHAYYQALLDVVKNYKAYSVLGHHDLIVRYDELGVYLLMKSKI